MSKTNTDSIKKVMTKNVVKPKTLAKKTKTLFKSDVKETALLVKAGHIGAANAIRESRALGLPITYLENGTIYKEYPDGTKEKIGTVPVKKRASNKEGLTLKKGTVLHARK